MLVPWRLHAVVLARPFPPVYQGYTDWIVSPSDVALVIAVCAGTIAHVRARRPLRLGPPVLSLPVAGIVIAGWVSIVPSQDRLGSFYHSLRLLLLGGVYLLLLNQSMGWAWIVVPVGLMVTTQGIVAIAQSLAQGSVGISALGEYSLDPSWEGVSVVLSQGERILRAYGLSDHPNILGGSFALGCLVLLTASVRARESAQPWLVAACGFSLVGLMLTFSRAATLGLVVGALVLAGGVYVAFERESLLRLLRVSAASAALLAPFVLHFAPALFTRAGGAGSFEANPLEQRSLVERTALNRTVSEVFTEHALSGVGLGALPIALRAEFPEFPFSYQPAHIVLLDAAAETGLLGATFYAAALLAPAACLAALWRRGTFSPGLLGSSAALLGIAVIGLFDYYPWLLEPGRLWQWCLWGVWAREYSRSVHV